MATATLQKVDKGIQLLIAQAVHEVLTDPDFGCGLRESVKKKLHAARRQTKTIPFAVIKQKYA